METVTQTKNRSYTWENRLSYNDRIEITTLYQEGFAVYALAVRYGLTPSTIEYHLRVKRVYIPNRRPTKPASMLPPLQVPKRTISYQPSRTIKTVDMNHLYLGADNEWHKTKTYQDYLAEEQNRTPITRSNRGGVYDLDRDYKCWIRVSLV